MTQIIMDISKYEEMKESEKLLGNSLEKERELQKQIKKLTDEKTKALECAQKKVVKIVHYENIDNLFLSKEPDTIEISKYLDEIRETKFYEQHLEGDMTIKEVIDLFLKEKKKNLITKHITTYGLDEIENELRKELKEELNREIENNLKYVEYVELENKELKSNIDSLKKKNGELFDKIKQVRKSLNFIIDYTYIIKRKDIKEVFKIIEKEENE